MKAKCNHKCSVLGNMDYLGAIDRMANAIPLPNIYKNTKAPRKVSEYLPISNIAGFDPYPKSEDRMYKKFMHYGPANSKSLTDNQTTHLIHKLKERGYSSGEAKKISAEGKMLSKKYMNSPWAKVPATYRKKYGGIDFDGDGVPNDMDCYPFDFDRQAAITQSQITSPIKTTKSSSGTTVYNYSYTDSKGNKMTTSTTQDPSKLPSGSSSSSGSSKSSSSTSIDWNKVSAGQITASGYGNLSSWKAAVESGKTSVTPSTIQKVGTTSTGGGIYSSTTLFSPSTGQYGPYIDAQLIPNTGVYDVTTQTYTDPQGNKTSRSQKDVPSGATIMAGVGTEQATRVVQPGDYYLAEVPETPAKTITTTEESPIYSDMTDQEKYAQIYNDILSGKINDPAEVKRLMEKIAPYKKDYDFNMRVLQSKNLFEQKKRGLLTGADTDFLNQKVFQKRQDILQQKATAKLELANKKIEDVTKSFNKEIETQVQKETESRKGEYTTKGITGYNVKTTTTNIPASTALKLAVLKA